MNEIDFTQLVHARLGPLVLYARQFDAATAEDLVHEAFLKLAGKIREGIPPHNPDSWLYSTVRNLAMDQFRARKVFQKHAENFTQSRESWFVCDQDAQLDGELLTRQLQELPLEEREVIVAHLWGGQSFREIAEWTGSSFSTVRRQFHSGITALREFGARASRPHLGDSGVSPEFGTVNVHVSKEKEKEKEKRNNA